MSVLINMEMPKSCADCPIGDSLCCPLMPGVPALWREYTLAIRTNRRHEECPLVPVPKHGRLVDADALEIKMWNRKYKYGRESDPDCLVVDAPTIIPADQPKEEV